MDFTPSPHLAFSEAFQGVIDAACQAVNAQQTPRSYLGASRLGEECDRKLGYEYRHYPKDPGRDFAGKILRVFDRGHDGETRMAQYIRAAGFTLLTERPDGRQFGFYIAKDEDGNPRIAGHMDGVITTLPDTLPDSLRDMKVPCLWENKVLNSKSWGETVKKGVRVSKPVYYSQMQTYMSYFDLAENPGLFTAMNGDTGEIYAELVPFDPRTAQDASDRGVRVVMSATPEELPRVARERTDFRCKFCDYAATCWAEPVEAPQATAWSGWGR